MDGVVILGWFFGFIIVIGLLIIGYEVFNYFYIKHKEKKRLEAIMKRNNPKGYKVGDTVHVVGMWHINEKIPYKIERADVYEAYVNGWWINYSTLRPHKKIYLGGE